MDAVKATSSLGPVEALRAAAALMRERAEAATVGASLDRYTHGGGRMATFAADDRHLVADFFDEGNREHYAAWQPAVALALADQLDAQADRAESMWIVNDLGERVARAYLSGEGVVTP
jgi:anti-sigma factor ChrR (cupin superfamily)